MSNPGTVHCSACGQATPAIAFCGHCGGPLPRVVEDTAKTQFGLPAFDATGALDDAKTLASMPAQAAVPAVTAASVAPAGPIASRPIEAAPPTEPFTPPAAFATHAPSAAASMGGANLGALEAWREPEKLARLLGVAAIALFVTRFIPVMVSGGTVWTWTGDGESVFRAMVFPILVAAGYAFVAFAPGPMRENLPAGLLRGLPFVLSYLGTALLYAAAPIAAMMNGGGIVAWFYPALVIGLFALAKDRQDPIARGLVAVGGGMTFIGGMIGVGFLFRFSGAPALLILHNIIFFLLVLTALGSVVFAVPSAWWPQVDGLAKYAGLVAGVLLAWPLLSGLLFAMAVPGVSKLTVLLHTWTLVFGLLFVLWLTAPAALASLRKLAAVSSRP